MHTSATWLNQGDAISLTSVQIKTSDVQERHGVTGDHNHKTAYKGPHLNVNQSFQHPDTF